MATALSVLKKALLLGQRGKTTTLDDDVAPASYSYELEVHAKTCEKYAVVLRAVYTVIGPNPKISKPLLLQAKAKGINCPSRVKKLVEHHVRVLAAGMSADQMLVVNGSSNFVKEALGGVNLDLAKSESGGGLFVCRARLERFAVHVPSNRPSMVPSTQRTMAAVAVVEPATKKAYRGKQIRVAAGVVGTQVRMEVQVQNKPTTAGFTQRTSVQVDVNNVSVAVAVAVTDPATMMIKVASGGGGTQVMMQLTAH